MLDEGRAFDLQEVAQQCEVVLLGRVQAHAAHMHAHCDSSTVRSFDSAEFVSKRNTVRGVLVDHGRPFPSFDNTTLVSVRQREKPLFERWRKVERHGSHAQRAENVVLAGYHKVECNAG
jgi:hypothetical protein